MFNRGVKTFSFDHLSSVQFEEFCYDLLVRLGAKRVSWRKGTGFSSSPSDQGRDIECDFLQDEPDGVQRQERWFVECKHHKEGVSPAKIFGALAWATAERPDVLLLIASNAFSNSCKNHLDQYKATNRPQFRIKLWELKELEGFTLTKPDLLRKYGMADDFPFLQLLHPAHVRFIREPPLNTLKFFFETLEKAGPHRFRNALDIASLSILKPTVRLPVDGLETFDDLIQTPVGFVDFRQKCFEVAKSVHQSFLVRAIVNDALCCAFMLADITDFDRVMKNTESLIRHLEEERNSNPNQAREFSQQIEKVKAHLDELPAQCREHYDLYAAFCDEVVAPLFSEQVDFAPEFIARMEQLTGKKLRRPK